MTPPTLVAIVPAAGVGARAAANGQPKQYRLLAGQPMLRLAVRALLADSRIAQIRVAVSAADVWAEAALRGLPRTVIRRCGGPARADTVRAALLDADLPEAAWVLVHDAARPGLPADALGRLIDTCLRTGRGGILALPVDDTVKQGRPAPAAVPAEPARGSRELAAPDSLCEIAATRSRESLWLAQTPQMFRVGELLPALRACAGDVQVTDEASAVERLAGQGRTPLLVRGARENFKLTWPEDFAWFEKHATGDRT
ncbi:MAG: 2-C-methyl-D-erythritol 4-phosphate cytidylyltransferase [Castellaniella sp.]|uniref:2-C-methyl-D-erythritol 4-phosphate cytidylyltransferase n=1 Tax=Castellaniella sp. TaxID=1955812 RepID=UPI0012115252|nr:2-C-methyl-D-erythritol 4-phosphate cytidylyltransferase [Castellaniella sp.]TAN30199.1 MAG: 2-C-methyl-D-erythritol 4-phosphate cytidylyltransferase [Castellaniella sp.]